MPKSTQLVPPSVLYSQPYEKTLSPPVGTVPIIKAGVLPIHITWLALSSLLLIPGCTTTAAVSVAPLQGPEIIISLYQVFTVGEAVNVFPFSAVISVNKTLLVLLCH